MVRPIGSTRPLHTHLFRRSRSRGAAAVEFALVMPVLVVMMMGIVEFGNAFFVQSSVANAARVGVRSYSINWATPNAASNAIALAKSTLPDPTAVVSASFSPTCTSAGGQTTLVITYTYHSLTGMFDFLLGSDVAVAGQGSMACGG